MFIPRALRLKSVKEAQKRKPHKTAAASRPDEDALEQAIPKTNTDAVAASTTTSYQEKQNDKRLDAKSSKSPHSTVSAEYLAQLAAGVELIFTDYAHQDTESAQWLQYRYRTIDAGEKCTWSFVLTGAIYCAPQWCGSIQVALDSIDPLGRTTTHLPIDIHLTAILEHSNIATLKPEANQIFLRQALQEVPSQILELSTNESYVRRRPTTYPAAFVPTNSFQVVNDDGISFWDQRTIYVEPHIRNLCKTPAKVAHWLKENGQLRAKWLPVQAVHTLYNSCAFVVLSGNVTHEDLWKKWRATEKPENWKVMTKMENLKRTEEYIALRKASIAEVASKRESGRTNAAKNGQQITRGSLGNREEVDGQQTARKRGGDEDIQDRMTKREA